MTYPMAKRPWRGGPCIESQSVWRGLDLVGVHLDIKEVYREDKIKEWDPVDPSELEHFLQIIIDQGREHSKSLSLYPYLHGLSPSKSNIKPDY